MMQIPIQIWCKYFIITHYRIKRHEPCNIVLVLPMNKVDLCSTTKPSKAAGENKRDSKKWAQSKLYESPPLLPKKVKKLRLSAFSSNSLMQHRETCTQRPSINRPVFEDFDFFLDKNTVIVRKKVKHFRVDKWKKQAFIHNTHSTVTTNVWFTKLTYILKEIWPTWKLIIIQGNFTLSTPLSL